MKLAAWILALLGVMLLGVAAWMAGKSAWLMSTGTRAVGEIVDIRMIPGGGSSTASRAPVVQFRAESRIVRGQLQSSKDPVYGKGDHVPLYYAIESPQRFVVADFDQMWLRPIVVSCLALVIFAAARIVWMAMLGVKDSAIFSLTFQLIGMAMLVGCAIAALAQWAELRSSIHTVGTVKNGRGEPWRLFKSGDDMPLDAEISFTHSTGRKMTVIDKAVDAKYLAPNESVHVFYDPERPERARIASLNALWLNAILVGLFGLAFYGAGTLVSRKLI